MKRKKAKSFESTSFDTTRIESIYLNLRKDLNKKCTKTEVTEKHVAMFTKPRYKAFIFCYVVPANDNSNHITNILLSFLVKVNTICDSLITICCDETIVDIGWQSGVVRRLEEILRRLFHCLFFSYITW